jgi:hypothetical protein
MAKHLPSTNADNWMIKGIAESNAGQKRFRETKVHAMNAGMCFIRAREAVKEGNFELFLETFLSRISRRTVYCHMAFVQAALEWAAAEKPELASEPTRLFEHAKTMVMMSPKPFVALMRQIGEMRKFGEYDAVKYQTRNLLGDGGRQMELDFAKVCSSIDLLSRIDEASFTWELPEGKDRGAALEEIEVKLETALVKVRAARQSN